MGWYRYVFRKHDSGARTAAVVADVEVGGVGVAGEYHVAGPVGDAVVGVGSEVVDELEHVGVGVLCGRGLLLGKIAEGYNEFVIDCLGVVLDCADELLGAQLTSVVERWALKYLGCMLDLCALVDGSVAVRGMLGFLGVGVVELCS